MDRVGDASKLLDLLDTGTPSEIARALNELAGVLDTLLPPQRELVAAAARKGLDSPDSALRGQAVFALGELGDDPSLLERGLDDSDWFIRLASVTALARAKPPIRIKEIARLRDDPEPLVRDAVLATLDGHDSRGGPTRRGTARITWQEWSKRELAYVREDMTRRDRWNNFLWWMVAFSIAIAAISLLFGRASLGETIGVAIATSVGMAPLMWIRGWKREHHPLHGTSRFDLMEFVIAGGWAMGVVGLMAFALALGR